MNKRAQAALEFLSTYGFAFLIILVMIGALAYFGVLNPQRFLPERCLMGTEFECRDYIIQQDTPGPGDFQMKFVIGNNLGNTVTLYDPMVGAATAPAFGQTWDCVPVATSLPAAQTMQVTCTNGGGGAALPGVGEKIKIEISFAYQELGGSFDHVVNGEVFAQIQ